MAGYWRVYFHQIGLLVHAKAWPKTSLPIPLRRIILPWQRQGVSTASTINRNSVDEYYRQNQSIQSNKKMAPPRIPSVVNTLPCSERRFCHNILLDFLNFKTSCTPTTPASSTSKKIPEFPNCMHFLDLRYSQPHSSCYSVQVALNIVQFGVTSIYHNLNKGVISSKARLARSSLLTPLTT